ncbi:hypothetical protein GCM10023333_03200 [Ferrimonas pelagia]|uniref:Uncharacterized protein n=1 Tax=Ferrimonas pelagia TaxID=1177826 RepID=A0ABP9ECE7_9GAMM
MRNTKMNHSPTFRLNQILSKIVTPDFTEPRKQPRLWRFKSEASGSLFQRPTAATLAVHR